MKSKLFILSLLGPLFLAGCVSKNIDMSGFGIDQFSQIEKTCVSDSQCKVTTVGYEDCANFRYMVYSTETIFGANERSLLEKTESYTEKELQSFGGANCVFMTGAPSKGACYKKKCEMVKTWR